MQLSQCAFRPPNQWGQKQTKSHTVITPSPPDQALKMPRLPSLLNKALCHAKRGGMSSPTMLGHGARLSMEKHQRTSVTCHRTEEVIKVRLHVANITMSTSGRKLSKARIASSPEKYPLRSVIKLWFCLRWPDFSC